MNYFDTCFVIKTKRVYVQFSELKIISLESQVIEKYSGARNHMWSTRVAGVNWANTENEIKNVTETTSLCLH
jgi:hypothetical protein